MPLNRPTEKTIPTSQSYNKIQGRTGSPLRGHRSLHLYRWSSAADLSGFWGQKPECFFLPVLDLSLKAGGNLRVERHPQIIATFFFFQLAPVMMVPCAVMLRPEVEMVRIRGLGDLVLSVLRQGETYHIADSRFSWR